MSDTPSEIQPAWLLPAREHEPRFSVGDLNVLRDHGTARVKALVAIIDGLLGAAPLPPETP